MEDYEILFDTRCPHCGHSEVRYRDCDNFECQDGMVDEYQQDPINFMEGEEYHTCPDCHGTGSITWCPNCGERIIDTKESEDESDDDYYYDDDEPEE